MTTDKELLPPLPWRVDPDKREGMEYNNHILDANGNTVCFMAWSGDHANNLAHENAASAICEAINTRKQPDDFIGAYQPDFTQQTRDYQAGIIKGLRMAVERIQKLRDSQAQAAKYTGGYFAHERLTAYDWAMEDLKREADKLEKERG